MPADSKPRLDAAVPREAEGTQHFVTIWLVAAMVIAIAAFLIRVTVDSDTWWQVAIGRDILSHLRVPRFDHFAAAAWGRPYHDSHWLFQVLLAAADKLGGMAAVSMVMIAAWGGTFFFCYRAARRWAYPSVCCILVFVAAIACSDRFIPRPEIVTYLMVAVFYFLLQERRFTTTFQLAIFAFLQAVWANSHGLFVIGPLLAACNLVPAFILSPAERKEELAARLKLLGVLLASSLVTPFGVFGWSYAFLLAKEAGPGSSSLFKGLMELTPTFGEVARSFPDFWCYLVLLVCLALTTVPALFRRGMPYGRLLMVVALLALSLTGRRNMTLFALAAAPFIAENVCLLGLRRRIPLAVNVSLAVVMLALAYLPLSGTYYHAFNLPLRFGIGMAPEAYSAKLPDIVPSSGVKGVVYSPPYLGGYALYHGFRPIVDGRWEVYDPNALDQVLQARFDSRTWRAVVDAYDIRAVMVGFGEYDTEHLLQRLSEDRRFRQVYSDDAVSFWVRSF